jgi:hypothetical protein
MQMDRDRSVRRRSTRPRRHALMARAGIGDCRPKRHRRRSEGRGPYRELVTQEMSALQHTRPELPAISASRVGVKRLALSPAKFTSRLCPVGAVDEQAAEIIVPSFANSTKARFATGGVCRGTSPKPGGELSGTAEYARICNSCCDRSGDNRPYPRDP